MCKGKLPAVMSSAQIALPGRGKALFWISVQLLHTKLLVQAVAGSTRMRSQQARCSAGVNGFVSLTSMRIQPFIPAEDLSKYIQSPSKRVQGGWSSQI